ncbi:hypothetical protein [Rhodohalobacter barkolensis]|uniref:Uncharacterized protein n=1 Tax=Rhodohalobacter barkolensis TaxID=2053187 RepID=A0A2N0VMA8_9BACT|nr:hypothetical protein [Rhodohalobacter barkolensis]PKD45289.1 hypothetical protein CWD77_07555 [Rhodohalobacter barkolensis]
MTLNSRKDYIDSEASQGSKSNSLELAHQFVKEIHSDIAPLLQECIIFDSEKTLGNAPAVEIPNDKLAIAPDIRCTTHEGNVFWFEVKDKSQRFYYPDTGADLFQVYGWYNINKHYSEPVFVLFKDPPFDSCIPKTPSEKNLEKFKPRWSKFNGKPYGAWLSQLLELNNNYPRIFNERSRNQQMPILYFLISQMQPVTSWQALIDEVDGKNIPDVKETFEAYHNRTNKLLDEDKVRGIIAALFSK